MLNRVLTLRLSCVVATLLLALSAHGAITPPAGALPTGAPARILVGLYEQWDETWMHDSAVSWDARYAYLSKGWANNWGWGAHDGSMALKFFNQSAGYGYMPAVQFYQMNGESGGGEAQFLAKTQNATTMAGYFGDFKLLMQQAKTFGKPVIVMLEADGFAFLQRQSGGNPNTYSAVAATGLPELASLPNSVAGWGMAFLQIRKAVGASNVLLGVHVSGWATNRDLFYTSVTDELQPAVDATYNFLAPLGLATNKTGATFDFLVSDPCDRDADFYRITQGVDRWWSASDNAATNTKSFNRYAEWLHLWNVKTAKRWVVWQIPLGNSNHLNVPNSGQSREGYKDNRPEYFFGANSRAHLEKFASSGVFALLFGAGEGQQSSYHNDAYTDGQLFMKSRAGAFLKSGGLAIPGGSGGGGGTTPTPPPANDASDYSFEGDAQGWQRSGAPIVSVVRSTAAKFAGTASLAVQVNGTGTARVFVSKPAAKAGQTVIYHIYVPANAHLASIQAYVLQGASGQWRWSGNWQAGTSFAPGSWATLTVQVPANAALLDSLGVEITTSGAYSGTIYVDSVNF